MKPSRYSIPEPVGKLLASLPAYPGSVLFATLLNMVLGKHLPLDTQQSLTGKTLRISVTDARLSFDFEWIAHKFAARMPRGACDLTIAASAHDFLLLARRQEDPDTLFFSRRLVIEGDTELGLLVKNMLDAIDLSALESAQRGPARLLLRLMQKGRVAAN